MNFISWAFALLFIPVLLIRLTIGRSKTEPAYAWALIVASTVFCAWHVPVYVLIIFTSIFVDYVVSLAMGRFAPGDRWRRWLIVVSVVSNLGLLGFFKYTNFLTASIADLLHAFGVDAALPRTDLVLPMGISFYTFCSMSYTIDVYRERLQPVRRFRELYLFLTFFPHLVAGPIVRADQFLYQLDRVRRVRWRVVSEGIFLIIRGLFLKTVCADNLATVVQAHWSAAYAKDAAAAPAVVALLGFSFQIFCDFEGYSSIARGLAYVLGYRLPLNFDNPYLATSFKNFWERWHMSLSQWLRDYLYVSLGGNRVSRGRTYVNLMIVMLLGGLWHGAAATFVAWGLLHGASLAIERALDLHVRTRGSVWVTGAWFLVVQTMVLVTWVFFRSDTCGHALAFMRTAFTGPWAEGAPWPQLAFALPALGMHVHGKLVEKGWTPPLGRRGKALLAGVMLYFCLTLYGDNNAFIYFQF